MRSEGREIDMGPIGMRDEEGREVEVLPPDYQQATEPLPGQSVRDQNQL
jgi:hypothetical protein